MTANKSDLIDLGLNPEDGAPLMNGQHLPDGQTYQMADTATDRPVMKIGGVPLGDPED